MLIERLFNLHLITKYMKILLIIILSISNFLFLWCSKQNEIENQEISQNKTIITGNYLWSYYKGNYIWGWAMNLAWNDLNENILHEKLKLKTDDKIALEMTEKLNNPIFTKNDLDNKSYYVKSWFGQETINIINKESKERFPSKSFDDLKINLSPTDIISYAYFLKEVEYKTVFEKDDILFNWNKIEWFYAKNKSQKDNIEVIKYENDDKFIINLWLKEQDDNLFLVKGYDMNNPESAINDINKNKNLYTSINNSDTFMAPKLHIDFHRDYIELIHKKLANNNFTNFIISKMFENIKFDMDEKWARVENEAVISVSITWMFLEKSLEKPRNFIIDKPYWLIMQRKNSNNPYFILWINNIEFMK